MKTEELIARCEGSIKTAEELKLSRALITLVYPRGSKVIKKDFPRGELLCVNYNGDRVYHYDARKVLAALKKALGEGKNT